jgi:hypothetical protein
VVWSIIHLMRVLRMDLIPSSVDHPVALLGISLT